MAVALTSYLRVLRAVLGDRDLDIPMYDDRALVDGVAAIISLSEVPGYELTSDGNSIQQSANSQNQPLDLGYQYLYGYNFGYAYANTYNNWYDQGFMYYMNYQPPTQAPGAGDLTPSGNPDAYAMLIWKTAQLFVANLSDQHFRTRAFTESIQAPKELVWLIQEKVYNIENGKQSSGRPAPLPMIAVGIRSFWSGLWPGTFGLSWGYYGFDLASF